MVLLRERRRPSAGFIEPCLPSLAKKPPAGPDWIHEIKHDGFRIIAHREGARARLMSREGNDLTDRFPFLALAVAGLEAQSFLIDGEAIVCDENGVAVFDLIRGFGPKVATLCAFDLLEVDGRDLRRDPIEDRKKALAHLLEGAPNAVVLNAHYEEEGALVYREACRLGCEGIVSKRRGSPYRSGRSGHWLKIKNPRAPAAKREWET